MDFIIALMMAILAAIANPAPRTYGTFVDMSARPDVVVVVGFEPPAEPISVDPPQRLDIVVAGDSMAVTDFVAQCNDAGGQPTDTTGDEYRCTGVDY